MNNILLSQEGTKKAIEIALKANTPLFITGSGGMGKSSIVKQVAEEMDLHLIDMRLSQVLPMDLMGYPKDVNNKMEYLPIGELVLEGEEIPNGKSGVLIFLDELNQADKYTQGAAYRLLLDRQIGKYNLHPNTRIIGAGNRIQDMAIVNKLVSPMKTRLTHIEMYVNNKEFLEYVKDQVTQGEWDSLVYAFLNFKPEHINNFDPKVETTTYSVPRTMHMLSKQIQAGLLDLSVDIYTPIICGIVGESAGIDFVSFLDVFKDLPTIQQVESDPLNTPIPEGIGAKWALGVHLSRQLTKTNANAVIDYCERIPERDLQVVVFGLLAMKDRTLMVNKKVQSILIQTQKQIAGI